MLTKIIIAIILVLFIILNLQVWELKRDYMSLKKAYCIHFVVEHIMPGWDKVAEHYLEVKYPIDRDDVQTWAINLLFNRTDRMEFFQCTLYQQMLDYVEKKIKSEFPINGILEFKNKNKKV